MENFSELSRKYREELLRMYSRRKPPEEKSQELTLPVNAPPAEIPPEPVPEISENSETPENSEISEIPEPEEIQEEETFEEPVLPEYIQPVPPPLPEEWSAQEIYDQRNTAEGKIYIVAAAANNAYPVSGAKVTIYTRIGNTLHLDYLLTTDESGRTPTVTLLAPPASLSQSPEDSAPYATCNVNIYASGYFREEALNVPVFAGVTSRQEFQMIPLPLSVREDAETILFPADTTGGV